VEIKALKEEYKAPKLKIHVWKKFEIENYAIVPSVIFRYIDKNKSKGTISDKVLNQKMYDIACDIITNSDVYKALKCKINSQNIYNHISGRVYFEQLSIWTQKEFGISISARNLIAYFKEEEVDDEIRSVILNIMKLQKLM
jgi:hypothetical protein